MIIQPDFLTHWRTRSLVRILGDEAAPLCLIRLWGHCQNSKDWRFDISVEVLHAICEGIGEPQAFYNALEEAGFVRKEGNQIVVVNWDEYNASLITSWENGKRGGRPKKPAGNPRVTQAKPTGIPPVTHGVPTGNPSQTDREDKIDERRLDREDRTPPNPPRGSFESFWAAYPKRCGRGAAEKAWAKAIKIHDWGEIVNAASEFAVSAIGRGDPKFIPHPSTWLNQQRWADDRATWDIEQGGGNGHRAGGGANRADAKTTANEARRDNYARATDWSEESAD